MNGLQELVDIYIKPASSQLSHKQHEERDHCPILRVKDCVQRCQCAVFISQGEFPTCTRICHCLLMMLLTALQTADTGGQLSLSMKAVGSMFMKHMAFIKICFTYIKLRIVM